MSITNPRYDPCAAQLYNNRNTNVLEHVMDPLMYVNCSKCSPVLGITNAPQPVEIKHKSDFIDLESSLLGINQHYSKCPSEYKPPAQNYEVRYLQPCQFSGHPAVPAPLPVKVSKCAK